MANPNFLISQASQFLSIRCSLKNYYLYLSIVLTISFNFPKQFFFTAVWLGEEVDFFLLGFIFLFLRERKGVIETQAPMLKEPQALFLFFPSSVNCFHFRSLHVAKLRKILPSKKGLRLR